MKAVNKATHSCLCSSPWVSTVRLKQPALSCGQGSASSLILTTSTSQQCLSVLGHPVYAIVEERLRVQAKIRIHGGKTKVWNRAGERSQICDVLERIARLQNPGAVVLRGSGILSDQQGMKVLGTTWVMLISSPSTCSQ